jgi:hypothetical protein
MTVVMQMEIEAQIRSSLGNTTMELDLTALDRAEDFGHLIMIGKSTQGYLVPGCHSISGQ